MPRFGQFLVNAMNFRPSRAMVQSSRKLRKFLFRSGGVDFDAAVIEIARETGEPELVGRTLGKVAEAHALHTPTNQPSPRGLWMRGHCLRDRPPGAAASLCDYGV